MTYALRAFHTSTHFTSKINIHDFYTGRFSVTLTLDLFTDNICSFIPSVELSISRFGWHCMRRDTMSHIQTVHRHTTYTYIYMYKFKQLCLHVPSTSFVESTTVHRDVLSLFWYISVSYYTSVNDGDGNSWVYRNSNNENMKIEILRIGCHQVILICTSKRA